MTKESARRLLGVKTDAALAATLGVSRQAVSRWPEDEIPASAMRRVVEAALKRLLREAGYDIQ